MLRNEFSMIMAALSQTFAVEMNELQIRGYWLVLKDVSAEACEKLAVKAMSEGDRMPKPSQLRPSQYRSQWKRKALASANASRIDHLRKMEAQGLQKLKEPMSAQQIVFRKFDRGA